MRRIFPFSTALRFGQVDRATTRDRPYYGPTGLRRGSYHCRVRSLDFVSSGDRAPLRSILVNCTISFIRQQSLEGEAFSDHSTGCARSLYMFAGLYWYAHAVVHWALKLRGTTGTNFVRS